MAPQSVLTYQIKHQEKNWKSNFHNFFGNALYADCILCLLLKLIDTPHMQVVGAGEGILKWLLDEISRREGG